MRKKKFAISEQFETLPVDYYTNVNEQAEKQQ